MGKTAEQLAGEAEQAAARVGIGLSCRLEMVPGEGYIPEAERGIYGPVMCSADGGQTYPFNAALIVRPGGADVLRRDIEAIRRREVIVPPPAWFAALPAMKLPAGAQVALARGTVVERGGAEILAPWARQAARPVPAAPIAAVRMWAPKGPAGDPVSAAIIAILSGLFGIFSGSASENIARPLQQIRDGIVRTAGVLQRFTHAVAFALGSVIQTIQRAWVRVIRPILERVRRIAEQIDRLINRVLRPYYDQIMRIRKAILDIYERYFRPVVEVIQAMRRVVAILRIARVPFARELDAFLVRAQAAVMRPINELLRRTSELGGWINILLRAKMVLQQAIFLGSTRAYAGGWIRQFWAYQDTSIDAAGRDYVARHGRLRPDAESEAEFTAGIVHRAGPMWERHQADADLVRAELRLP